MNPAKSPGAVEAAHGASETDDLGRRVDSESILARGLTQAPIGIGPAPHGGSNVHRALLDGAGGIATDAKPQADKSQTDALRIIIEPTKNGRKWTARIGDRVLSVAAAPLVQWARLLLAEGCPAESVIEMWRPGTDAWALRGRVGLVASVVRRILAGLYGTPPTVTRLSPRRIGISVAANRAGQESRERVA